MTMENYEKEIRDLLKPLISEVAQKKYKSWFKLTTLGFYDHKVIKVTATIYGMEGIPQNTIVQGGGKTWEDAWYNLKTKLKELSNVN